LANGDFAPLLKIHKKTNTDAIKLRIFTNFTMVFPIVALVFDFYDFFMKGVQNPHSLALIGMKSPWC
jgi:hypothetical protein